MEVTPSAGGGLGTADRLGMISTRPGSDARCDRGQRLHTTRRPWSCSRLLPQGSSEQELITDLNHVRDPQ